MGKVLKVQGDGIVVQLDSNGKKYKLKRSQFNFDPVEGDIIIFSRKDNEIYITKKELESDLSLSSDDLANDLDFPSYQSDSNDGSVKDTSVNKIVYILLMLFLGLVGAHRFYAKKADAPVYPLLFTFFLVGTFFSGPLFYGAFYYYLGSFARLILVGLTIKVIIDVFTVVPKPADASGHIYI